MQTGEQVLSKWSSQYSLLQVKDFSISKAKCLNEQNEVNFHSAMNFGEGIYLKLIEAHTLILLK